MNHARRALGLAIIVAISDLLAGKISSRLGLHNHWWTLVIAAAIAVIILMISYKYNPFRRITLLRRWVFGEIAIYEGFWASDVKHPERPFSISQIYYSHSLNRWVCQGYALSTSHKIVASWKGISIYFDPESKFWFFKGLWYVHQIGSAVPVFPARDQFFKIKTNPGSINKLTTVIVDNLDAVGDPQPDDRSKPEILISDVRRITNDDFEDAFNFVPKKIDDLTRCHAKDFGRLLKRYFPGTPNSQS